MGQRGVLPQVPEIISSIRQAGKIARQEELHCPSEFDDTFAKKFEVLFCGRVTVAHKKAPPALIDECIEKFNHISGSRKAEFDLGCQNSETTNPVGGFSFTDKFRAVLQPVGNGEQSQRPMRKSFSQPGLRSLAFKKEFQDGSLRSSSFFSSFEESDIENHLLSGHNIVQPTDIEENRTMLFTIGQSEVYLISPDTKKVALEKNFKEISFCSQGIRHVDHFGFICRESSGGGGFHFVCYVFQCANEALVDEIMMTLKQAFTVAAVQQTAKAPAQLCEGCPLQSLHKLCERIEELGSRSQLQGEPGCGGSLAASLPPQRSREGASLPGDQPALLVTVAEAERIQELSSHTRMNSSKTKLELQKHLTTLTNQEQATIFEEVQTPQITAENIGSELPSSATRFRLDVLKNKAKRSLTESLESILSRGNKARSLQEQSTSIDLDSSMCSTSSNTSRGLSVTKGPGIASPEELGALRLPVALEAGHVVTQNEPCACDKEALPVSESSFRLLGSSDDLSSDSESHPAGESTPLSPQPSFRRRANTLSHVPVAGPEPLAPAESPPGVSQRKLMRYHSVSTETPHERNISYRNALRKKLHSSSSVPNFLKFLAPVDENNTSDFMNTKRDIKSEANHLADGSGGPVKTRRPSWRQQIFLRVATPQKASDSPSRYEVEMALLKLPGHVWDTLCRHGCEQTPLSFPMEDSVLMSVSSPSSFSGPSCCGPSTG
ncbi:TBC1 domain family member 1 [Galemys pyrenaicus]|uniref:TBC1 domain family member 1 n=1 Tax=Galemys pyrenaicus TaxID=202257 RepID=A0A8J6ACL3_GALPY|nr:TBC1 domain family member 1 [Galemys pyrenaicus]